MRNCSNGDLANTSSKSTLDPCSLSKTLRCVFLDAVHSSVTDRVTPSSVVGAFNGFYFHFQYQVDVHVNEKAGINFLDITGGLSTNELANAITKMLADKEVQLVVRFNFVYKNHDFCYCIIVYKT